MTDLTWNRLGSREKEVLAILRHADTPQSSRDILEALGEGNEEVAYTTVSTVLDRLVEKDLVTREEGGDSTTRYLHRYDAQGFRDAFIDDIVADVADVFGDEGLKVLVEYAQLAQTDTDTTKL